MRINRPSPFSRIGLVLALVLPGCTSTLHAPRDTADLIPVTVENHTLETVFVHVAGRGLEGERLGRVVSMGRRTFHLPNVYTKGVEIELFSVPVTGRLGVAGHAISHPFRMGDRQAVHWTIRDGQVMSAVTFR